MFARTLSLVVLLAPLACQENILNSKDGVEDPIIDTDLPWDFPDTQIDSPVETADTGIVASDCQVKIAPEREVAILEECTGSGGGGIVTDPWNMKIEYQYTSGGYGVIVMPAVGNVNDDNGDGKVDEDDIPDIAFTTWVSNTLVVLSGDGSGPLFELSGYDGQGGVTIADVDSDGDPEVVAFRTGYKIAAVSGKGVEEWVSSSFSMQSYPQPAVADLDGDGDVEVVGDTGLVNGKDGSTIAALANPSNSWRTPVLGDIDLDGKQEIILAKNVYDYKGTLLWSNSGTGAGNFNALANIDSDKEAEVFFVSGSTLYIHEDDGTLIRSVSIPGSNPGPPSVADFDGDGAVEIAIPANTRISVFEVDGTKRWESNINDTSGLAGCSGYDINGDGAYEVLYADQDNLFVYDGASGSILYQNSTHSSGTVWEYPVIADVDKDGSAEVIIASNSYGGSGGSSWSGVTVFGHDGDGWPRSGETWGTHDFAVSNLNPDGTVPETPETPWLKYNVFRARPAVDDPSSPNLSITATDLCVASCDGGPIKVAVQVSNNGSVEVEAGVSWVWYKNDGGTLEVRQTGTLPLLPSGKALASFELVLTPDDFGSSGYVLAIDDDGLGNDNIFECDEADNQYLFGDSICR